MREADFYAKIRAVLHAPPLRVCRKLQDRYLKGLPDSIYSISLGSKSTVGWVELKYHERWPVKGGPLTLGLRVEQVRFLEEWAATGGHAWALLGVGDVMYMFKAPGSIRDVALPLQLANHHEAVQLAWFSCRIKRADTLLSFLSLQGVHE